MSDLRNWLERLGAKIPGYAGYSERERRRDADKQHREQLAERLRALKTPLNETLRRMADGGRLFETGPVERLIKKLDHAENRVRFASYGYTGFFDATRVEEAQLEELYRFDLMLVEQFDELARALSEYQQRVASEAKPSTAEVERAVDEFNQTFDRRQGVIGGGGASAGARGPMFGAEQS